MLKLVHNADSVSAPKTSSNLMTLKVRIVEATGGAAAAKQEALPEQPDLLVEAMPQVEKSSA